MTNYLNEAFQKLSLVEDDFNFSARDTGVADELKSFVADDIDIVDEEPIIDVEANSTGDLQASYVGKAVLECDCCHSRIFRDKDKVIIDEGTGLANIDEACTVCGEKGWVVKGKVEEFEPEHEDEEKEEAEEEVEETEEKPEKKAKKEDEEDEEEVEESLKEAFEEAYGDCEDCGDDIPMEENAIMDRVRAKMELGESEEKFPDPSKHDYVKTVEGTKMYYCNDCGKYAAKIDGKKVKADSEEELEKKIKKGAGALKEGVNMNKLRRKLEMGESCEDCDGDFEEAFDPERVRAKMLGEALHVEADGEDKVTVDKADDGSMDIHVGPGGESDFTADDIPMEDTEGLEAGDEMITPLSDEEEEEIKANTGEEEDEFDFGDEFGGEEGMPAEEGEVAPVEDEEPVEEEPEEEEEIKGESLEVSGNAINEDYDVEDFDEESFDEMAESYVRRVYEDVEAYKTTDVAVNESQLVVEGLITMRSGATKPTKFIFENAAITKRGKLVLEGMNTTFSNKKNAFVLKGTLTEGKFIGESMLYKYPAKALNESKQMETYLCSGRVIAKKK